MAAAGLGGFVQGLGFALTVRSITWMPAALKAPRPQVWMDSLGDWAWPGQQPVIGHGRGLASAEVLPPPWVPTMPATAPRRGQVAEPLPAAWQRGRRIAVAVLLVALAAVSAALVLQRPLGLTAGGAPRAQAAARRAGPEARLLPTPTLATVHVDGAGSSVLKAHYSSVALHRPGGYYVYLPPGTSKAALAAHSGTGSAGRLPVLYLLHGNSQSATAFLQMGIQAELDRLIAARQIPPLIAVMIQGGPGDNNWRNMRSLHYESYVLEVQEIVDRTLPTLAQRGARAIAGDSMGGYGAMRLTLGNPYRFGVVESWLGFFNGLEAQLHLDRHAISTLGLHAFLYGGQSDKIADPSENAPFAAQLRAAGAHATSAVYPGEHSVETLEAHLSSMLTFAGHHLQR